MTFMTRYCAMAIFAALLSIAASAVIAAEFDPWAAAYDSDGQRRFIPVELWTGGAWNGNHDLAPTTADLKFGASGKKAIEGPFEWQRPGTGEKLIAYARTNQGKRQLFVVSSNKDGIGRVEDSRYSRNCVDEVKFPLGLWAQDEQRIFDIACNDGAMHRQIVLTVEKIDFSYGGTAHSLQFHWVVDGGRGKGTDMHYLYSPGKGLVSEWGNE
jgi:hypothetical protein